MATEPSTDVLPELLRPGRRPAEHPPPCAPAAGLPPPPAGRPPPSAWRRVGQGEPGLLRVLICDELPVVRDGLRVLLAMEPDIQVIGTADSGGKALASISAQRPDVAITGLALRGVKALELIRWLSQGACGGPAPKVIVFVMNDDADVIASLLRANVNGLLVVNDTSKAELAAAIRAAARRHTMVSPSITRHLVDWFREFGGEPTEEMKAVRARPAPKERDVLGLIAEGMSPEAVAGELVISVATVRTHIYRARIKPEARDRAQLAAMAHGSAWSVAAEDHRRPRRVTPARQGSLPPAARHRAMICLATAAARASTVGESNTARSGRSIMKSRRILAASRVTSSEWPPRSKKLSRTLIGAGPSNSLNRAAMACQRGPQP